MIILLCKYFSYVFIIKKQIMKNRETPTIPSLTFYRAGLEQGFTDGKCEIQAHEILTGKRAEYQLGYINGFKLGQEILNGKTK